MFGSCEPVITQLDSSENVLVTRLTFRAHHNSFPMYLRAIDIICILAAALKTPGKQKNTIAKNENLHAEKKCFLESLLFSNLIRSKVT